MTHTSDHQGSFYSDHSHLGAWDQESLCVWHTSRASNKHRRTQLLKWGWGWRISTERTLRYIIFLCIISKYFLEGGNKCFPTTTHSTHCWITWLPCSPTIITLGGQQTGLGVSWTSSGTDWEKVHIRKYHSVWVDIVLSRFWLTNFQTEGTILAWVSLGHEYKKSRQGLPRDGQWHYRESIPALQCSMCFQQWLHSRMDSYKGHLDAKVDSSG